MLEGFLHGLLGDLVEGHAPDLLPFLGAGPQLQREVVGDRFPFAVRIGRQEDFVGLGRCPFQLGHDFFFIRSDHQRRLEGPILQFHADFLLGQVHDVPDRRQDFEPLAKILFDRLRLGGRLDDYQ